MFRVLTQESGERENLERECLSGQGCLLAPAGQVQSVVGLVRSIAYEYFQADLPHLAAKVSEFAVEALGMSFSLSLLREIMAEIRRQAGLLKFYQNYMAAMNRELAFQDLPQGQQAGGQFVGGTVTAFEANVGQRSSIRDSFAKGEFCLDGKAEGDGEANTEITEKTMQSQIIQAENSTLFLNTQSKFSELSKGTVTPVSSICDLRRKEQQNDSSMQLRVFQKKGGSVMGNSIEALMRSEIEEDLRHEATCQRSQARHSEVEQFRYNRLIKDGLMNGKLKRRRR